MFGNKRGAKLARLHLPLLSKPTQAAQSATTTKQKTTQLPRSSKITQHLGIKPASILPPEGRRGVRKAAIGPSRTGRRISTTATDSSGAPAPPVPALGAAPTQRASPGPPESLRSRRKAADNYCAFLGRLIPEGSRAAGRYKMKYSNIFASSALFETSALRNRLHVACRNERQKGFWLFFFLLKWIPLAAVPTAFFLLLLLFSHARVFRSSISTFRLFKIKLQLLV